MNKGSAISERVIRAAVVDSSRLERALEIQLKSGDSLRKILANLGLVDESAVSAAIAKELRLECLGADLPEILPETARLLLQISAISAWSCP